MSISVTRHISSNKNHMLEITSLFVAACGFLDGKLLCYNPAVSNSFMKSLQMKIRNTVSACLRLGSPQAQSSKRGAHREQREAGGCSLPGEQIFHSFERDTCDSSSPLPSSLFSFSYIQPQVCCQARCLLSRGRVNVETSPTGIRCVRV